MRFVLHSVAALSLACVAAAQTEQHLMVPMRDGTKLSVYLYFPEGKGPWPVLYEQRYSDVTVASGRTNYVAMAMNGYVVAAQNSDGCQFRPPRHVSW